MGAAYALVMYPSRAHLGCLYLKDPTASLPAVTPPPTMGHVTRRAGVSALSSMALKACPSAMRVSVGVWGPCRQGACFCHVRVDGQPIGIRAMHSQLCRSISSVGVHSLGMDAQQGNGCTVEGWMHDMGQSQLQRGFALESCCVLLRASLLPHILHQDCV